MYTLYSRPGSGGFIAEAALTLVGLPFTLVNRGRAPAEPEFLAISPLGQVPALTLPDGRTITETSAIMLYIADLHPEAKLAPAVDDPARPEFLRWTMFMAAALYPALLRWFYAPRYTSDPGGVEGVKDAALVEIDRCFAIIEDALADRRWIAGEAFTIADPYLLMLAHWHPVGDRPRAEWTRIVDLCARAGAVPALASLNASHKIW